jgi:hypothetical protein
MLSNLEKILRHLTYRLAFLAIRRARSLSWYIRELLRNRLATGLVTPAEVLATIWSLRAASK